jgi:flagellar biosynthesis protein FlhB
MEEKDIIKIWKKESDKSNNEKPITMETIENIVKLKSGKASKKIRWDLYISLVLYIAGIILTTYAAVLYRAHNYLKWVLPVMILVLIVFLIQNIILIKKYNSLKSLDISLREKVSGIIRYYKGGHKLWQLLYPVGMLILVFNVSLLIDYDNGNFRINHPLEFILVMVVAFIFMYFPMQYTHNVFLQDLENCLRNLDEHDYLSNEKSIKRYRIFLMLFIIGLVLLVLGSLVAWYFFARK